MCPTLYFQFRHSNKITHICPIFNCHISIKTRVLFFSKLFTIDYKIILRDFFVLRLVNKSSCGIWYAKIDSGLLKCRCKALVRYVYLNVGVRHWSATFPLSDMARNQ